MALTPHKFGPGITRELSTANFAYSMIDVILRVIAIRNIPKKYSGNLKNPYKIMKLSV
jgi:hypothetical protein